MTTYLAFNNLPLEKIQEDCTLDVEVDVTANSVKSYEAVVPLLDKDNEHFLKILEEKFGKFDQKDDPKLEVEHADTVFVASFSAKIPEAKDFYTSEELDDCDVSFMRFDCDLS